MAPVHVMPCHSPFRVHLENGPQEDWQAFPFKSSHFGRPLLKPRLSNQVMDTIQGLQCTWLLSWLPVQTVDILLLNVAASPSFRRQLLGLRVCRWLGHVGYIFLTILLSLLVRLAGSPETPIEGLVFASFRAFIVFLWVTLVCRQHPLLIPIVTPYIWNI